MNYQDIKNEIIALGFEEQAILNEYPEQFRTAITRALKVVATTVKAPVGSILLRLAKEQTEYFYTPLGETTFTLASKIDTTAEKPVSVFYLNDGGNWNQITDGITIGTNTVTISESHLPPAEGKNNIEIKYKKIADVSDETGRYDLWELSKDRHGNVLFDSIDRVTTGDTTVRSFGAYELLEDHIFSIDPAYPNDLTIYYNQRVIPVTGDTENDDELTVYYSCEPLIGLLAAHYVWLDDDERKAILYWNEYDSLKQEIQAKLNAPKARVIGGLRW